MARAPSPDRSLGGALVAIAAVLFAGGCVAACSIADIPGTGSSASTVGPAPGSPECLSSQQTLEAPDIAKLSACACAAGGKAHCVGKDKIPSALSKQLEACESAAGACVPDSIIEGGGAPPPTCKTAGAEGRCVSLCVPKVAKYADDLTRGDGASCAEDERCVPCKLPDESSSGICEIGAPPPASCAGDAGAGGEASGPSKGISCPFTGTEADVSQRPVCAPGGRCVKKTSLDELVTDPKTRSELEARLETCATGLCVPEEYLKKYGQHRPAACSSFAGIEGRCFSTVFKDVKAQKDLLQRDTCEPNDRCIPCFNPADGAPTGACTTVSCDAATKTPPTLKDCCRVKGQTRGKCVPKTDVPEQFRPRLADHECDDVAELCVPSENLDLKAKVSSCQSTGGGKGVCVSNCIEFRLIENIFLRQGTCREDQTCVPCIDPKTKQPTGAPGCS